MIKRKLKNNNKLLTQNFFKLMKNYLRFAVTVTFLVAFAYVDVWGQQVPTNWTDDTGIDTYKESTNPHGWSSCAKIDVNTGTQGNCDFDNQTDISVTAGESYTVKFWYKTSAHVKGRIHMMWTGANATYGSYTNADVSSWTEFTESGTVPSGATSVKIGIRFYDQSNFSAPETQYIDDLTFESPTGTSLTVTNGDLESWPSSGGPDDPSAFAASASATDQIDLSWTKNGDGDDVMIVFDTDNTFTDPVDGTSYTVGNSALGGTVLYNGSGTSYNHTSLTANTHYYYKAWSVDGSTNYSSGVTTDATPYASEPANHPTARRHR